MKSLFKTSFFSFSFLASAVLFFSCSASEPAVLAVNAAVVFDYSASTLPEVSLSVFVQTENEVQRARTLKVDLKSQNLSWTVTDPVTISHNRKNWVGYPSLKVSSGQKIENGDYEILYTQADGEEVSAVFKVDYDEKLLETEFENVRNVAGSSLSEITVLYDKEMNMLFYGTAKKSWKTNSNILRDYTRAVYRRKVLTNVSGNLVFKPPLEKLSETR